jgi:RimJ/RimL family protein N-acetyltransferase
MMVMKRASLQLALLFFVVFANTATACFVCVVPYQSLLDKVEESEQVVVARTADFAQSEWQIVRILKGQRDSKLETSDAIQETDQAKLGELQLLRRSTENDPWTNEGFVDPQLLQFLSGAVALSSSQSASSSVRQQSQTLRYFLPYLENQDPHIADSAYNKLARAPYEVIRYLGKDFEPDQLLAWINDQQIPSQRRSLYITLLGFCGHESESILLKEWIDWRWEHGNSGDLTVLLAAHAELNGEETIRYIEQSYLKDRNRKLDEIIAAVDALRLHGQAQGTIPRARILTSFNLLLRERPALAELIIEDCARWKEWSFSPQLMEFYTSGQQPWNNALIIKYLEGCPLDAAKRFVAQQSSESRQITGSTK